MTEPTPSLYTAFEGHRRIAAGPLADVARIVKITSDGSPKAPILIFNDDTGEQVDLDLGGSVADVVARLSPASMAPRPGRPKLGVVAREVTLLPRHWDWLGRQPGGASVALRKLVDAASKTGSDRDRLRQAQAAAYRFLSALAGNLGNFEEASRALFAGNAAQFGDLIRDWPADVRDHAQKMTAAVFEDTAAA